jgi:RNA polymerase sigma-70 factor (ECF subfamily)
VSRVLVERAQQGDRDAYEELARSSARRLFLVASRILRDNDAADDAVQQALVAIWRDLPLLSDPDRFEAWTYRIVVRYCRRETRRRWPGARVIDVSDQLAATSDGISEVDVRDELGRAFDHLTREQRTVVVLRHLVGMPIAEIAEILDIPYGTVGSRLHSGMRAMRAHMFTSDEEHATGGQPA